MQTTLSLKDRRAFSRLYGRGRFVSCREVTVYYLKNRQGLTRLGVTAGKRVGNAVKRNRAKRIIKSAYRLCEGIIPKGYDYVFVARPDIDGKKSTHIEEFIRKRLVKEILSSQKELRGHNASGGHGKKGSNEKNS